MDATKFGPSYPGSEARPCLMKNMNFISYDIKWKYEAGKRSMFRLQMLYKLCGLRCRLSQYFSRFMRLSPFSSLSCARLQSEPQDSCRFRAGRAIVDWRPVWTARTIPTKSPVVLFRSPSSAGYPHCSLGLVSFGSSGGTSRVIDRRPDAAAQSACEA